LAQQGIIIFTIALEATVSLKMLVPMEGLGLLEIKDLRKVEELTREKILKIVIMWTGMKRVCPTWDQHYLI
jgi:hypothetical protein